MSKRVPNNTQRRGDESMEDKEHQQEEMEEYINQKEEWQKKLMRAFMEEMAQHQSRP
jgi:hypothetical protein